MKVIKRIFFIIATVVLFFLFLFNFYTFFCIKIAKQDLATINGYALLEVVSGSMEPIIHIGDMIVIDTKTTHYQENDIVTFYDVNGSFVTHRILSIKGEDMITKGDNNNSEDESIPLKNIVGKYVFKVNGLGKILASFKSPFVMIMILIIGFMVCFLISTDKEGKPILTQEEKEFQEFIKNKEKKLNESKNDVKIKQTNVKNVDEEDKRVAKKVQESKTSLKTKSFVPKKKLNKMSTKKRKNNKKKSR